MEQLQAFPWPELNFQKLTAIFAVAVVAVVVYLGADRKAKKIRARLPPGPRPWPIIGNLGILGKLVHQDFATLSKQYGPIMLLWLGSERSIVVSSPQIAEEVLKTHDKVFASRPHLTNGKILGYDWTSIGSAPYGPYWRDIRKVFTLELFTAKRMQQFQSMRREEVLATLHSIVDEGKSGKAVHMDVKLGDMAKNNITRMMINKSYFGPNSGASNLKEESSIQSTLRQLFILASMFVLGDHIPLFRNFDVQGCIKEMRAIRRTMDNMLDKIIEEHRQKHLEPSDGQARGSDVMDIVDVLVTRPCEVDEKPFTNDQVKAILQDTLIAGTDTQSNTLEWTMAEILRNPRVRKRAQDELDEVVGRDRLVEESDIPRLPYLCAVVKETFRLHPAAPLLIPHFSMEACEVGGYHIPSKSRVFVNVWAIGRDPAVWDRPLEFYPERFLTNKMDVNGQDFELLPFGSGRRSCPGRPLGVLMVQYTLAVLLHACDWTPPQGMKPEDVDLSEGPGLTLPKAIPLQAVAIPRLPLPVIYAHQKS